MMRAAFELLQKLTEKWPPDGDVNRHHILLSDDNGETKLLLRLRRFGKWEPMTFDAFDLDVSVDTVIANIEAVFAARKDPG